MWNANHSIYNVNNAITITKIQLIAVMRHIWYMVIIWGVTLNCPYVTTSHGGSNGYTTFTFPINIQDSMDVQCGLCNYKVENCNSAALQHTVISLPVQLISFGK